jgi:hypothetical protein
MGSPESKVLVKSASARGLSALSPTEVRDLTRYEDTISKGWDTFIAVGQALTHIRDKGLYRAEFHSFETYCRHKWHYRRAHAYRLIGAAEVIQVLSPIGDISLPRNEAQVRPLLGLKPDELQTVWRNVLAMAGKRPITADLVRHAVTEFKQRAHPKTDPPDGPIPEEVACVVLNAGKLLSRVKRTMKAGDLAKTMILLHDLRQTLQFETSGNSRRKEL